MPIYDAPGTLATFERLLADLRRYRQLFNDGGWEQEAEALRADLNIAVAGIRDDLDDLRVSRVVNMMGHNLDVLNTALTPVNDYNAAIPGQLLDSAVQLMETAVGAARRLVQQRQREAEQAAAAAATARAEENAAVEAELNRASVVIPLPPEDVWTKRFQQIGAQTMMVAAAYLWGRYRDWIWNRSIAFATEHRTPLIMIASGIVIVVGGYAINIASSGKFREHPVRNALALALAFAAAIAAIVLGKM